MLQTQNWIQCGHFSVHTVMLPQLFVLTQSCFPQLVCSHSHVAPRFCVDTVMFLQPLCSHNHVAPSFCVDTVVFPCCPQVSASTPDSLVAGMDVYLGSSPNAVTVQQPQHDTRGTIFTSPLDASFAFSFPNNYIACVIFFPS